MASAPQSQSVVRIGVLGCGNVGAAFIELVERQAHIIEARTGVRLQVARVAVRNVSRDRDVELPEGVVTRDAMSVVNDPTVDLIVEVIGGIEPARELISAALSNGKPVVTENPLPAEMWGYDTVRKQPVLVSNSAMPLSPLFALPAPRTDYLSKSGFNADADSNEIVLPPLFRAAPQP